MMTSTVQLDSMVQEDQQQQIYQAISVHNQSHTQQYNANDHHNIVVCDENVSIVYEDNHEMQTDVVDNSNNSHCEQPSIVSSDDILQQAFQQAGNTIIEEGDHAIDGGVEEEETESEIIPFATPNLAEEIILNSVIESTFVAEDGNQYAILKSQEDGSQRVVMMNEDMEEEMAEPSQSPTELETIDSMQPEYSIDNTDSNIEPLHEIAPNSVPIDNDCPLGSSGNPIRIIQQGNQYTSLQQLTPDQLTHIMQVLQQQQAAKTEKQGATTLYSPQTNTKIVYRVIYPSADKKTKPQFVKTLPSARGKSKGTGRGRGRPRRIPIETQEDEVLTPTLTKEEKDFRKKMRMKTRSGRISKPPKHMVKDYKHIHLVEWDEDYDDSDGGYSDFKHSSGEDGEERDDDDNPDSDDGSESRRRRVACPECSKSYVGQASLNRHFRIHPTHGIPTEMPVHAVPTDDVRERYNPSSITLNSTLPPVVVEKKPRNGCYARQGRVPKRIQKLKDIIKLYPDEELLEVVLPRIAKCLTTWEFLLSRSEKGPVPRPSLLDMIDEYEHLLREIRKYGSDHFKRVDEPVDDSIEKFKIDDQSIASSLNLESDTWYSSKKLEMYTPVQYKYLKLRANADNNLKKSFPRVISPPRKRIRLEPLAEPSDCAVVSIPGTITSTKVHTSQPATIRLHEPFSVKPDLLVQDTSHALVSSNHVLDKPFLNTLTVERSSVNAVKSSTTHVRSLLTEKIYSTNNFESIVLPSADRTSLDNVLARSESQVIHKAVKDDSVDFTHALESHSIQNSVADTQCVDSVMSCGSQKTDDVTLNGVDVIVEDTEHAPQAADATVEATDNTDNANTVTDNTNAVTDNINAVTSADDDENMKVLIMQTDDGMLLIQKPDGTTLQVQHNGDSIPIETLQYLLSMDSSALASAEAGEET